MVLHKVLSRDRKIRFKRPEIWENKSKEEIKENLLKIINTEGAEPFVKGVNQEKSSIDEFLEENEYLLDEPLEDIIAKSIKDNIDDIVDYIYNHNAYNATYFIEFDKPVYAYLKNNGEKITENSIAVEIYPGLYDWSEEEKDKEYFYKYYYDFSIW